jgi:hypothetical protein
MLFEMQDKPQFYTGTREGHFNAFTFRALNGFMGLGPLVVVEDAPDLLVRNSLPFPVVAPFLGCRGDCTIHQLLRTAVVRINAESNLASQESPPARQVLLLSALTFRKCKEGTTVV